jgi:protoheme ferro-lyase
MVEHHTVVLFFLLLNTPALTFPHIWQSRVGPIQWLKPYTDEVLVELGQKGVKSLLAVPVR